MQRHAPAVAQIATVHHKEVCYAQTAYPCMSGHSHSSIKLLKTVGMLSSGQKMGFVSLQAKIF